MSSSAHPLAAPASILTVNLAPARHYRERFGFAAPARRSNPSEIAPIRPFRRPNQPRLGRCPPPANRLNEPHAPVAQLDRALPSEGKGHTFESCRVRQLRRIRHVLRSVTPGYAGRNSVSWERRYLTAFGVRISALLFG